MSQNLFSSLVRGEPRAGICSVCGSSLGILCFVVCIIISLIIRFCMSLYMVCVVVCMIRSCLGRKDCLGSGQSSDVEPGEHDEQGQGRTAFHKFIQILGKVYFESPN